MVSPTGRTCHTCKHLFLDWIKGGLLVCSQPCYEQGPLFGKFLIDKAKALPALEVDCEHYQSSVAHRSLPSSSASLLISVITLGTRNDLLTKTIASIIENNDVNGDIVVTVDGQADEERALNIEQSIGNSEIPVFYVGERVGICEALNRSLAELLPQYSFVMFSDDDMRHFAPLSTYLNVLQQYSTVGAVSGFHDARMPVSDCVSLQDFGLALLKPMSSGCHLVMRAAEVQKMLPFKGGHWLEDLLGFDYWVLKDAEASINNIGKATIVLPRRVEHLGWGRSTWEGREQETKDLLGVSDPSPVPNRYDAV